MQSVLRVPGGLGGGVSGSLYANTGKRETDHHGSTYAVESFAL